MCLTVNVRSAVVGVSAVDFVKGQLPTILLTTLIFLQPRLWVVDAAKDAYITHNTTTTPDSGLLVAGTAGQSDYFFSAVVGVRAVGFEAGLSPTTSFATSYIITATHYRLLVSPTPHTHPHNTQQRRTVVSPMMQYFL